MVTAVRRRPRQELAPLDPAQVDRARELWPQRAGLVLLAGAGARDRELEEAVAAVLDRHREHLWGGRLDAALFPKMLEEYARARGFSREELEAALPAVALLRGGKILTMILPGAFFPGGRARLRALTDQVDTFARKFAVDYRPPAPAGGGGRPAGGDGGEEG